MGVLLVEAEAVGTADLERAAAEMVALVKVDVACSVGVHMAHRGTRTELLGGCVPSRGEAESRRARYER
jgi:hypothetical protein